jgi:tetratricopeptide (TPR) repeat protein
MRYGKSALVLLLVGCLLASTGCRKLRARDELNKGVRAYKAADFEKAIEHFKRANELDPTLLNARVYLATAYASQFVPGSPSAENKKLAEAAIREFERALEVDPKNLTALGYIASLYFGMGEFEKSKEFRKRLIEVDPQNPEHYYSIGVIDWTLTYKPRMELKNRLKLLPDAALPRRERERLAETSMPIVDEGLATLQKALELNPKYLDAIAYLNLMYREKADLVASPQEREQYLQMADDLVDRHKRLREEATGSAPAS